MSSSAIVFRSAPSLHLLSGAVLAVFVALHLFNHAMAALDVNAAFAMMDTLRAVYRWPPAEALLVACLVFQVVSGLRLLQRRGGAAAPGRAVRLSACYLLFFLVVHVAAVFWGRYGAGLDTNLYFAAAGFHAWPYALFFVPYYALAVLAIFVHLGQALRRHAGAGGRNGRAWLWGALAGGVLVAGLVIGGLSGWGNELQVPDSYMALYPR